MRLARVLALVVCSGIATAALAAIDVSVSIYPAPQAPIGGSLLAAVTVRNVGSDTATGTQLAYLPPSPVTFVKFTTDTTAAIPCLTPPVGATGEIQCTIPTIASQQSVTITFVGNVPASVAPGTPLVLTAIAAAPGDSNPSNDRATITETASPIPDIAVDSTLPASFVAGTTVPYSITLHNNGGSATKIRFEDRTDQGGGATYVELLQRSGPAAACYGPHGDVGTDHLSCLFATFPAGATARFDVKLAMGPTVYGYDIQESLRLFDDDMSITLANIVKKSSGGQVADAAVAGSAPASVFAGDTVPYTVTATNAGPSSTSASVTWATPPATTFVSATSSAQITCTAPAAGASGSVTCPVTLDPGTAVNFVFRARTTAPGAIVNSAAIAGPNDPNPANNATSATTTVGEPASADVSLAMSAAPYALAGRPFTVLLTFSNAGPQSANGVTAAGALPTGIAVDPSSQCVANGAFAVCNAGDIASGVSVRKSLVVTAASEMATATFAATATSTTADPSAANNAASASLTIYPPLADVGITVAPLPSVVAPGGELVFNVVVANRGPAPATVGFAANFPSGSAVISAPGCATLAGGGGAACGTELFPGLTAPFPIHVKLTTTTGAYTVPFHLTSSVPDGNPADNDVTVALTVDDAQPAGADLALTLFPTAVTVAPRAPFAFAVAIENRGTAAASGVKLHAALPAGMTLLSAGSASASCVGSEEIDCTMAALDVGASEVLRVVVNAPPSIGVSTLELRASSSAADLDPANDAASLGVVVVEHPRRRPGGH